MKIKVQIKRQEKQNTAPYIQHFLYEGDGKLTVADFLAELNRRDPLLTAEGLPASRITYESGCHEKKCGACAMLVNGLPQLACSVFLTCAVQKNGSLTLAPLSKFPVIRDLKVDRATTFEILKKCRFGWIIKQTLRKTGTDSVNMRRGNVWLAAAVWKFVPIIAQETLLAVPPPWFKLTK